MNPLWCASLICLFGGLGGVVNALLTDNGFALPRKESGVWCPGAISNIIIGSLAAFSSWAFYGSGAEFAFTDRSAAISLKFSVLAGAFLIGVAGAKWITAEVDKRLLKESVKVAASSEKMPKERSERIAKASPRRVLQDVREASSTYAGAEAV